MLAHRPGLATRISGALSLIALHPAKMALAMRFARGLRTILPVAAGMSGVSPDRFFMLNLLSAALWAPLVAGLGWSFGDLITRLRHRTGCET